MKQSIFFILAFSYSLLGAPGCLDNSYHLQQRNDPGTWHAVACNCPCGSPGYPIMADGTCIRCRHRRDAQPLNIVTYHGQEAESEEYPSMETIINNFLTAEK